MYVKYGSFAFEPWEAGLAVRATPNRSKRGFKKTINVQFDIEGELCVSGQSNITARLNQIEAAFRYDGYDCGLYHDDNTPSFHYLNSSHIYNLTGNQVLYANYPQTKNGEYSTGRMFSIGVGAEMVDAEQNLLDYSDSIGLVGNAGPTYGWNFHRKWGYYPVRTSPTSLQRIVHSGYAVGMVAHITPPTPFYSPPFEDNLRRYVYWGPAKRSPQGLTEYVTQWRYYYTLPVADDLLRPTQR